MKLLVIFLFVFHQVYSHGTCDNPITDLKITSTHQNESLHVRSKRAAQNIRIARYYDDSYNSLPNKDSITSLILDPAIQFWQNALMVKNPLTSPLLIDRACSDSYSYKTVGSNRIKVCSTTCATSQLCYTTQIPSQFIQSCYTSNNAGGYVQSGTPGAGSPNTDLLLIVTQKTDGCGSNVLAYALACELEYTLDRPVIGLINICPGKVSTGVGLRMSIATIKHEIVHVLGLSSNLFAFYRDQNGNPLTPRDAGGIPNLGQKSVGTSSIYQYSDNTVKDFVKTFNYNTGQASKTVSYIVTPTVQNETRAYFNCPTMEGLMLEDYGTSSSALSHFKKLYLQNELMTASISVQSLASRLTLAVLQDTGWYMANLNNAENFVTAKNLGCNYVTKSCFDYMNMMASSSQSMAPFCNQLITTAGLSCTNDMLQQVYCNLYANSALAATVPAQYQYFPNTNLVSNDPYSDYCPSIIVYANYLTSGLINTGECNDPQNVAVQGTANDYFNQGFSTNSICVGFDKSTPWIYQSCGSSFTPTVQGAGCYQYQCQSGFGLIIVVNNLQFQCTSKGQVIDVSSRNIFLAPRGRIVCPDCSSVCSSAICNSVTSTLALQCNNIDRLCPGVSSYIIPCSTSLLKIGLFSQIWMLIVFFFLKP